MQQEDVKANGDVVAPAPIDTSVLYSNPAELERVLYSLTQPNNTELKKATIILTDFLTKPQSVVPLLQQMEQSKKEEVRQMAAVYLREQVESAWEKIPKDTQGKLKAFLITKLQCEFRPERLAVAACISSVAKFELIHNEWETLLQALSKMCDPAVTANSDMREIGVTIWRNVIQFCGGALKKHFGIILGILEKCLNDDKSLRTQVEAVKAIGLMVEFLENQTEIQIIENVIPNMCGVIERCLKAGDEDNVLAGMEVFNDLAESKIPILNKHAKQLVQFNTGIASAKGKLPMTVRKQAVNFIMWMASSKPKTVIKQAFLQDFLQLGMNLVLENASMTEKELEEMQNAQLMNAKDDDLKADDGLVAFNSPLAMGCDLLDQIFKCLPSETVFPMGVKAIEALMNQKTDPGRQTAYTVIAMMVEGCDTMIAKGNNLHILLDTSINGTKDQHPMVRKCSLEAITQLATHMQHKVLPYHERLFGSLFSIFDRDNEDIRVIERALNAIEMYIDAFTDASEEERGDFDLAKYAPTVMQIVEKCIKSNVVELRTQSLTTVASVASGCGTKFQPYLDGTMKLLESALKSTDDRPQGQQQLTDEELASNVALRAEATSCLGSVAFAVGYDLYEPYFEQFHKVVMDGLNEIDDSTLRESTFIYFSEIARLVGENVTKLKSFEDMLISILWIMADDDGVQVKMPDDGFGGSSKLPGMEDPEEAEKLITLALEDTKLDDLQNMSEQELEALLRKTMEHAAVGDDDDDNQNNDQDDNADDEDEDDAEEQERLRRIQDSVGQLQTVKLSVRTGFMEEKAAAIHCLTQFIRHGGDGMLQNLDTCFDALLRLWDYPHQLVKLALINCFHAFFESIMAFVLKEELQKGNAEPTEEDTGDLTHLKYKWAVGDRTFYEKYDENVRSYIEEMFPLYIQAIIDEDENDTLNLLIDNFIEELRILGPSAINEYMNDLVAAIKQFLNGKSALLRTGDDPDDEETQKIVTKHEYVIDAIAELISTMAELWGKQFMQVWNELFPCLLKFGNPNKHPHDRAMVVGCIADVCSNLAQLSRDNPNDQTLRGLMSNFSNECFQMALTVAQSTDVNMRQNALYCIGALFTACNQNSNLQHSNDCLRCLQVYMKFPKDGTRGEQLVRDNAVSALGKVIISEPEALPAKELIGPFVTSLPLTQDFSENKYIYDTMMRLVLEEPDLIKPYIGKVLSLLADALPSETIGPKTTRKIITFFQKICTDKGIQQVVQTLNNENQTNIRQALAQQQQGQQ